MPPVGAKRDHRSWHSYKNDPPPSWSVKVGDKSVPREALAKIVEAWVLKFNCDPNDVAGALGIGYSAVAAICANPASMSIEAGRKIADIISKSEAPSFALASSETATAFRNLVGILKGDNSSIIIKEKDLEYEDPKAKQSQKVAQRYKEEKAKKKAVDPAATETTAQNKAESAQALPSDYITQEEEDKMAVNEKELKALKGKIDELTGENEELRSERDRVLDDLKAAQENLILAEKERDEARKEAFTAKAECERLKESYNDSLEHISASAEADKERVRKLKQLVNGLIEELI